MTYLERREKQFREGEMATKERREISKIREKGKPTQRAIREKIILLFSKKPLRAATTS